MRTLRKPDDDAVLVLRQCAEDFSYAPTQEIKDRILASEAAVKQIVHDFGIAAVATMLHTLPQSDPIGGPGTATGNDMVKLYKTKFAKVGSPGRGIYDRLMMQPKNGICPLCGHHSVAELDHHLPKTKYPALAVAPINLIPACRDCNKEKIADSPSCPEEHTLHPYYDDFTKEQWLHADILNTTPPALKFSVRAPSTWTSLQVARAERHLTVFNLRKLYTVQAAEELINMRESLLSEFRRDGAAGVRQYLAETAHSRRSAHLNSWQTATYTALSNSIWFCAEGYSKIV